MKTETLSFEVEKMKIKNGGRQQLTNLILKTQFESLNPQMRLRTLFPNLNIKKGAQWHNVLEMSAARRGTKQRKTN